MAMTDQDTTLLYLRELVAAVAHERDWEQFHAPTDLAAGLSIEAAEVLDLFLWKMPAEWRTWRVSRTRELMADELADVLIFCLNFANRLDFDLTTVATTKLPKNVTKYAVEKAKGSRWKYTELQRPSVSGHEARGTTTTIVNHEEACSRAMGRSSLATRTRTTRCAPPLPAALDVRQIDHWYETQQLRVGDAVAGTIRPE